MRGECTYIHDSEYSGPKAGGGGGESRKGSGRGKGGGADRPNNICFQCGKARDDHPDNRFCRREVVARLAPQPQAASATAYREGKGGGRGGKDNKKKTLLAPEKSDTEFTVLDGGAYLGYEEIVYARKTGASTRSI